MALIANLVIVGTPDNDELIAARTRPWTGFDDDNLILGLGGDDNIDGGGGTDVARYAHPRAAHEVFRHDPAGGVREAVVRGPEGVDWLRSIEFLDFAIVLGNPSAFERVPLGAFAAFPAFDYVASYPDLVLAIRGNPDLAWSHFRAFGAGEDRTVSFDGLQYVAGYGDLAAAFGRRGGAGAISDAGARHLIAFGQAEGRESDAFDEFQYLASYADLAPAGVDTPDELALHFIAYGRAEGRESDAFDEFQYLASYADLAPAGVDTPDELALHFIAYGRAEGRESDAFDEFQYLASYADLAPAGVDTPDELALHFIAYGRAEGRTDAGPAAGDAILIG